MLVYVARRWKTSAGLALWGLGVSSALLLTSPPFNHEDFPYKELEAHDIIYVRMHGLEGQSYLYNGDWHSSFSRKKLLEAKPNLDGVKVFLEGCYGMQTGIPDAFLMLGSAEVVASIEQTWNDKLRVGPAGKIGQKVLFHWLNDMQLPDELKSERATFLVNRRPTKEEGMA